MFASNMFPRQELRPASRPALAWDRFNWMQPAIEATIQNAECKKTCFVEKMDTDRNGIN
jgi:hypothetical protein